jgi:hypothetical protein
LWAKFDTKNGSVKLHPILTHCGLNLINTGNCVFVPVETVGGSENTVVVTEEYKRSMAVRRWC